MATDFVSDFESAVAKRDSLAAIGAQNKQQAIIDSIAAETARAKQDSIAPPKTEETKPSRRLPLQIADIPILSPDIMEAKNIELGKELTVMEQEIQDRDTRRQNMAGRQTEILNSLSHLQKIYNETEAEYATASRPAYWDTVFNTYDSDNPEDQAIISLTNQMNKLRTELSEIERQRLGELPVSYKGGGTGGGYSVSESEYDDMLYQSKVAEYKQREKLIKSQRKTQIYHKIDKLSPTDTTSVDSLLNTIFPTNDE